MKTAVALVTVVRLDEGPIEVDFTPPDEFEPVAAALERAGYAVQIVDAAGSPAGLFENLERSRPDVVFTYAERFRGDPTARCPIAAILEAAGVPYTGSDAVPTALSLDKWRTKALATACGVPCADGVVVDPRRGREAAAALAARGEVVVKPNYGGSSDGIDEHSIASDPDELPEILDRMLPVYPEGVLVEEYVAGTDVTVGLVVSSLQEVLLPSVEYLPEDAARTDHNLLAHAVKNDSELWSLVGAECPAPLEPDVEARLASLARTALTAVGVRDLARVDFRLGGERSSPILLELNAIPAVEEGTGVCIGAAARGWSIDDVVAGLTESALERARREPRRSSRPARRVREVS